MKTINEVLSYAPSSEKPGAWLKMKIKDDKGQDRDAYLKDAALIPLVNKPGRYEFEKQKNGQYWDIVGVKFLGGAGEGGTTTQAGGSAPRSSGSGDMNVIIQNRAITAQVAIKAAVELYGKSIESGAYKSPDGAVIDISGAVDGCIILARALMTEAGDFVRGKAEEKPGTRTEGGRTYEKVEGA